MLQEGKQVYDTHCTRCHGADGKANTYPNILTLDGIGQRMTLEEKVAQLRTAENLDVSEEAVKLAAPNMSFGEIGDTPQGADPFMHFILTGEDSR